MHDGKLSVLIVEDDVDAASMASKLIEKRFSASVLLAGDCRSARKSMASGQFDLVILDYNLPDGNGLELLGEIASRDDHPPVIMVTGEGDEEVAAEAFRLHASGYIVKDKRLPSMLPEVISSVISEIELKSAQEALRHSEEIENALLNAPSESALMLDRRGKILAVNRTGAERFGHTVEELVGTVVYDLFPPELVDSRRARIDEVFLTGRSVRFEDARAGRDFDSTVYPVFSSDGSVERVAVFATDITERKHHQLELEKAYDELENRVRERTAELARANEVLEAEIAERKRIEESLKLLSAQVQQQAQMLDQILSTSPDQFYLFDEKGKFIYASRPAAEALGFTQEAMSGRYWRDLGMPAGVMEKVDVQREKVMTEGKPVTYETEFPTVNGLRDYEYVLTPIVSPDGKVATIVATVRDVTEQNQARAALESHAARLGELARLLELTNDAITVRDMGSVITFWNRGAENMYGWKREEALGRVSHELLKTRFPEPLEDIEYELLNQGRWEGELVHTRRGGSEVVVSSRWVPKFDEAAEPQAILEISTDITEKRNSREQLERRTASLEEQAHLLDLVPDSIVVRDMNNLVTFWNRHAEELYGWQKEEAIGNDAHALLETTFPKPLEEIENELLRGGGWQGELVHATREGRRLTVSARWALQFDDAGKPAAILEISRPKAGGVSAVESGYALE